MPENSSYFRKRLIAWYLKNKRDLPWRQTKEPYRIWLSEIILQQTRVAQGTPYYHAFIDTFPTVYDLAKAPEDEVLKLWQGLGYYSRARNLHFTAKHVVNALDGVFPIDYKGLLTLKGVGDYTASAIASICYDEPTAVVDGNVYRVLSRVFGIDTTINSTQGIKDFKKLAQALLDTKRPGTFNQALMEFGARHCVPQNPNCNACIFNNRCEAFKNNIVSTLPVKTKKRKVKKRFFNYLVVLSNNDRTILRQRIGKGIWQGLYEFPCIETEAEVTLEELVKTQDFRKFAELQEVEDVSVYDENPVIHKLSHQHLVTRFWMVNVSEIPHQNSVEIAEIETFAVPVLIGNFISTFFKK